MSPYGGWLPTVFAFGVFGTLGVFGFAAFFADFAGVAGVVAAGAGGDAGVAVAIFFTGASGVAFVGERILRSDERMFGF